MSISKPTETPRLFLRTVTLEDVVAVADSMNLDDPPLSLKEAQEKVLWMLENHAKNVPGRIYHLCLAVIEKETGAWIGWCGLDHRDPQRDCPVLFYLLKRNWWGKGLATEAARALLNMAFREYYLPRVDSACAFDNTASRRVMEKIGMRYLGLDDSGGHLFSLSREEYFRGQSSADNEKRSR